MEAMKMAKIVPVVRAISCQVNKISQLRTMRLMAAPFTSLVGGLPKLKLGGSRVPLVVACRLTNEFSTDAANTTTMTIDNSAAWVSSGDPCLDLFLNAIQDSQATSQYLQRQLPLAWSHNPLTTIKLIFKLKKIADEKDYECTALTVAASWLHHNHPKTLLCNLASIPARPDGCVFHLIHLLSSLLEGQDGKEKYESDPDYQLLHDRITDHFVECLKSDLEKMKQSDYHCIHYVYANDEYDEFSSDDDDDDNANDKRKPHYLEISGAGDCLLSKNNEDARALRETFLCESVARKVYPPELYPEEYNEAAEDRVRKRLRKEFLVALKRYQLGCPNGWPVDVDEEEGNDWPMDVDCKNVDRQYQAMKAAISGKKFQSLIVVD